VAEPRTLTHKLLESHLRSGRLEPGEDIELDVDQVLLEDATGTMAGMQFEELGVDRVAVPLAITYVDHNVLGLDHRNMDDARYLQAFCARYGLLYSRPGNGISHYVHLERYARPGQVLVGADSHTSMAGALGMLAIGAGGLDVAVAMAGHGFALRCPAVVGVELRGELGPWVQAKDVILELLRRRGVRGGLDRVFEFTGGGVPALTATERATICNMIVETGGTTAVFPGDERVREWLAGQGREADFAAIAADEGASYDETEVIDLGELEPLIAQPSSPGDVVTVAELAGTEVAQVCVGSSVNSSYEDLALVGAVLKDAVVHERVQLTVTPGSRQILDVIARAGIYGDLVASGARMLEAICGPCIGVGQAPSAGVPSVRTFNRNFPGRSGTAGDAIYLCSPATAAATALNGEIADPRTLGDPPRIGAVEPRPEVDDRQIIAPPDAAAAREVEIPRPESIVAPPKGCPLPDAIEGRVTIVVGDDVSTGDMAPDGAIGMSLWSNIPDCARYMFRRQDPEFHDRALDWHGGVVVGGHNYGQGSSREQAALAALHLGIRAVVAKSFARIHRTNLVGQSILPLVFADEDDYDAVSQGDTWSLDSVRATVEAGDEDLVARVEGGGEIALRAVLSPRERDVLLAGGLRNLVRERSGRR
jgi:aconitate hydratase